MAHPQSGPMREQIRIESRSASQDSNGEPLSTWSLVAVRRAEKIQTTGRESWSSKERHARIPTLFRMRFPFDFEVLPQMRVTHAGKVYDVVSAVNEDGLKIFLVLTCEELVGEPQ